MSAIVLLSGGQDSATCLALAKQQHSVIHCICFDYGQRHQLEIDYSKKLAAYAGASFQRVDVRFLSQLTQSAMIHDDQAIEHNAGELPTTFVPGRNALFLTIAATIAYEKSINIIYTGVCQTDYSGYPDCRDNFIQSQQQTLSLAMDRPIKIETPLMYLTKSETVQVMQTLGCLDWYESTHTCYEGQRPACGQCPSCKLRLKGFLDAGIPDPLKYQNI
jgi:7-cyano-7-deazaguanine synthase